MMKNHLVFSSANLPKPIHIKLYYTIVYLSDEWLKFTVSKVPIENIILKILNIKYLELCTLIAPSCHLMLSLNNKGFT